MQMSNLQVSKLQDILDVAISKMQSCSKDLLALIPMLAIPGKVLTTSELNHLKAIIQVLAEALDQDSLRCQEEADKVKSGDIDLPWCGEPSDDVTLPASS